MPPRAWARGRCEPYDVAVPPGVSRPMALGFKTGETGRVVAAGEEGTLG